MTTEQLSELTGVSLRQLQWWDEGNIVSPGRSGLYARNYTVDQATVVGLVADLRRHGVQLAIARKVARAFEKHPTAEWLALTIRPYVASFAGGPVEVAEFAARAATSVVVAKIRRFTEADVPPAKPRKNRARPRGYQGFTPAESAERRAAGMLNPVELSLTRAALSRDKTRDYSLERDIDTARRRSAELGG